MSRCSRRIGFSRIRGGTSSSAAASIATVSLHFGVIARSGDDELIVDPAGTGATGELLLSSSGRSSYREAEVGAHLTHGPGWDLNVSYVRSTARGDLNSLTNYFDAVMWPVVGKNAYAPLNADVPHRLLARARAMPAPKWLLLVTADWRTGMPYSTVDDALDVR